MFGRPHEVSSDNTKAGTILTTSNTIVNGDTRSAARTMALNPIAFGCFEDQDDVDQRDVQLLKDLFHLDTREDASLLDGLDVRGVRELFQREGLEGKRAMADRLWNFILVADESVLNDVASGESIVKAVSLGWTKMEWWILGKIQRF
ncbi:hypothetical protein FocTR4_00014806 [Fusarium oxysporum f. sp. cubense]|uniref:Uncharacterized protein n=1 Tax=Fusarium oxysporum f. sp. cubense TaxID=61366 RepID=A0A5C6SW33_FUSOC|nr:hypothetical protein FocTR4_00014806 [Fusarium oxysporum f. sp. cubense]